MADSDDELDLLADLPDIGSDSDLDFDDLDEDFDDEDEEEDEEEPEPAPTPAPAPARRAPAPAPAPAPAAAAGTSASDARASVTDVLARMRAQREESRAKMAQSLNATVRLLLVHPASPSAGLSSLVRTRAGDALAAQRTSGASASASAGRSPEGRGSAEQGGASGGR